LHKFTHIGLHTRSSTTITQCISEVHCHTIHYTAIIYTRLSLWRHTN